MTGRLSLIGHSADVAAMFRSLLDVPTIGRRLARLLAATELSVDDQERLTALAALHDLGKINIGFQNKAIVTKGLRAGHVAPLLNLVVLGVAGSTPSIGPLFDEFCERGRFAEVDDLLFDAEGNLGPFEAIMAHHGRLPEVSAVDLRLWAASADYAPFAASAALIDAIRGWCPRAFASGRIQWTPAFGHAFAGLLTLADWLGSDATRFPFPEDGAPDGPERFAWSLEQAQQTVRRLHLEPAAVRRVASALIWSPLVLAGYARPSPAQAAMLKLPPAPGEGRLCLIEAETGSGKTEAALIHFVDLFRQGVVDGMYFALPTRAAAKQIHDRIEAALQRLLGDHAPPVGLAVPGYLREDDQAPMPAESNLWPDDEARDRHWATERPKRYLAGWVMVGTIDQALMGGIRVRHAQLRSAVLLRLLLVVDEVHASDVYMTALLRNLLAQHRRAGGNVLLMSATLGSAARAGFMQLEGRADRPGFERAVATPYPAVWTSTDTAPSSPPDDAASRPTKEVRVGLETRWDDPDAIVARAVDAASRGARVLVIRNTVRLAIATQIALERCGSALGFAVHSEAGKPIPCPHHARFAAEDRRRLDAALEAALGKAAVRQTGLIAVTTQTAEQSLDLDADLLITDLCPADVLLQRIGRLHRHDRPRPRGFEVASVIVVAPPEADLERAIDAKGDMRDAPLALGLVYPDLLGVLATRRALEAQPTLTIPADNRRLVEAATHPDHLGALADALGGTWHAQWVKVRGSRSAEATIAQKACIDWNARIQPLGQISERITTRLGLDDRVIILPAGTMGPFGRPIATLTVPARWLGDTPVEALPETVAIAPGELRITIGDRHVVYDRLGLRPL